MIPDSPTFNVREIAGLFQIQEETARRWIRRGDLPARRLPGKGAGYQVQNADLARYVELQYRPANLATSLPRLEQQLPPEPDSDLSQLNSIPGLVYIATGSFWARQVLANGGHLRYVEHFRSWIECMHPDDRMRTEELQKSGSLTIEYRLLHPDGTETWVADVAKVAGDQRWFGIVQDITDRMQREARRSRELAAYELLERALTGTNVLQEALSLASGVPGVARAEAARNAYPDTTPNLLDVTIPGKPDAWGVLRLHTESPDELADAIPLFEVIATAIGVVMLEDHSSHRPVRWYSTRDIARMLKVQEETVRRWIRREELQIISLGSFRAGYRVHPVDLDAFIRERYRQPGSPG